MERKVDNDRPATGRAGGHCCHPQETAAAGISRRQFLSAVGAAAALGGAALLTESQARAATAEQKAPPGSHASGPLKVKPALVYQLHQRREYVSWRPYGGLHTQADIDREAERIADELKRLTAEADFPMEALPLARVGNDAEAAAVRDGDCDVILVYASGGEQRWLETLAASKKPNVMFLRHKSGPIYLWYEIAHWRFLRKSEDKFREPNMDVWDIVVDDYGEVLWRLRSLHGLRNSLGTGVIALGGLLAYSRPGQEFGPTHAREVWKFDIKSVSYEELGERLKKARGDENVVRDVERQTEEFLGQKGVSLHTNKKSVANSFLAAKVFKEIMSEVGATSIGVGDCMGSLIRILETPPCLILSLLNDEGYTAFCHSDFTHTSPGILLHHISGKPVFLSNSHFPYKGVMTLAHCSAPRKMDGKDFEPTKIVTHFESDSGAATKVEFRKGQVITNVIPNLTCTKWYGFKGRITDTPSYDVCRSQIDMEILGNWRKLLEEMEGFHTVTCYGDYLREVGYALKKLGIKWENYSENA